MNASSTTEGLPSFASQRLSVGDRARFHDGQRGTIVAAVLGIPGFIFLSDSGARFTVRDDEVAPEAAALPKAPPPLLGAECRVIARRDVRRTRPTPMQATVAQLVQPTGTTAQRASGWTKNPPSRVDDEVATQATPAQLQQSHAKPAALPMLLQGMFRRADLPVPAPSGQQESECDDRAIEDEESAFEQRYAGEHPDDDYLGRPIQRTPAQLQQAQAAPQPAATLYGIAHLGAEGYAIFWRGQYEAQRFATRVAAIRELARRDVEPPRQATPCQQQQTNAGVHFPPKFLLPRRVSDGRSMLESPARGSLGANIEIRCAHEDPDFVKLVYGALVRSDFDMMPRSAQSLFRAYMTGRVRASAAYDIFSRCMKVFDPTNASLTKIQVNDVTTATDEARAMLRAAVRVPEVAGAPSSGKPTATEFDFADWIKPRSRAQRTARP